MVLRNSVKVSQSTLQKFHLSTSLIGTDWIVVEVLMIEGRFVISEGQ